MAMRKNDDFEYTKERIDGRLLSHSIHYLSGDIGEENVRECIKWIIYENLDTSPRNANKVLTLYINSSGGNLYDGFALIDIIKQSEIPIRTVCVGQAMSAAFLIFISGTQGYRKVARNACLMCHQYADTAEGKHHELKAYIREGEKCNTRMVGLIKEATGLSPAKIRSRLLKETDVYLNAEEALELNIADELF